jgi:tetratricopeptide (TPR) repeat protein
MMLTGFIDRLKSQPKNTDLALDVDDPADVFYAVEPLTLLICPLAGDTSGYSAQHMATRLSGRLGLKIEVLDRALTSAKADTFLPSSLSMAADLGQAWLKRHRADLLIWGDITKTGGWRLRFLSKSVAVQPGAATWTAIDRLEVPNLFPDSYSDLIFACALASADLETGSQYQERRALLDPLMTAVRDLAEGDRSGTVAEGATALSAYSAILLLQGAANGDLKTLEKAVSLSQAALIMGKDAFPPHEEAIVGARIADALSLIGDFKPGTKLPTRTVDHYRTAVSMVDRGDFPEMWAALNVRLGLALHGLALADEDLTLLQQAADAMTDATRVWTLTEHPVRWADIQNSLGGLLLTMGKLSQAPDLYDKAITVFLSIASVWTRTKAPLVWATTLANLGAALKEKGSAKNSPAILSKAADAFRQAGEVFTKLNMERYVAIADAEVAEIESALAARGA